MKPALKTKKAYFEVMRKLVKSGWNEVDVAYWKEHGWTEKGQTVEVKLPFSQDCDIYEENCVKPL